MTCGATTTVNGAPAPLTCNLETGHALIAHLKATHCPTCKTARRIDGARGRRKYVWTEKADHLLREHYKHNATAIAARFFPQWPKWAVVRRAQQLGLCRVKEKPWTRAEDQFITEHAGARTAHWMAKQLRTRTTTAIVVRLKRLQISRRIQADGLTLSQLEKAIGVDHRAIVSWARSGRLKGAYKTNPNEHERWEFQEADVAEFVLAHPSAFRLDRVDQVWFMALMREAVQRAAAGEGAAPRRSRRTELGPATTLARSELQPCSGAGDDTPCPLGKTVHAKPGLPARCPDCTLAFRRHLHSEQRERLKRIRTSAPVAARELVEA
jgi:hypothetical protein